MDRLELSEEKVEGLLEYINTFCFRNGKDEKEFIFEIDEVFNLSNSLDISPYDISSYIDKKHNKIKRS